MTNDGASDPRPRVKLEAVPSGSRVCSQAHLLPVTAPLAFSCHCVCAARFVCVSLIGLVRRVPGWGCGLIRGVSPWTGSKGAGLPETLLQDAQ